MCRYETVVKDTILKAFHNESEMQDIINEVVKDTILKAFHNKTICLWN